MNKKRLSGALVLEPNYSRCRWVFGVYYQARKDYIKAISAHTSAINFDQNNFRAYNSRANSYRYNGELDLALKDFNRAIEIDKYFAIAYASRSIVNMQLGHNHEAIDDLKRAKAIEANDQTLKIE